MIAEEDEAAVENENCYTNLVDLKHHTKKNKSKKNKRRPSDQTEEQKAQHNEIVQPKQGTEHSLSLGETDEWSFTPGVVHAKRSSKSSSIVVVA